MGGKERTFSSGSFFSLFGAHLVPFFFVKGDAKMNKTKNALVSLIFVMACITMPLQAYEPVINAFPICTAEGEQSMPRVDGDKVVWVDGSGDVHHIVIRDLTTGIEIPVLTSQTHVTWRPTISVLNGVDWKRAVRGFF